MSSALKDEHINAVDIRIIKEDPDSTIPARVLLHRHRFQETINDASSLIGIQFLQKYTYLLYNEDGSRFLQTRFVIRHKTVKEIMFTLNKLRDVFKVGVFASPSDTLRVKCRYRGNHRELHGVIVW